MRYIKTFESYNIEYDDDKLTKFRRSIVGYGSIEDLKDEYSFANEDDVNEIFEIIEFKIYFSFVTQKMNEYEGEKDSEVDNIVDSNIEFIKRTDGLSFNDGKLKLDGISKKDVIQQYLLSFY